VGLEAGLGATRQGINPSIHQPQEGERQGDRQEGNNEHRAAIPKQEGLLMNTSLFLGALTRGREVQDCYNGNSRKNILKSKKKNVSEKIRRRLRRRGGNPTPLETRAEEGRRIGLTRGRLQQERGTNEKKLKNQTFSEWDGGQSWKVRLKPKESELHQKWSKIREGDDPEKGIRDHLGEQLGNAG